MSISSQPNHSGYHHDKWTKLASNSTKGPEANEEPWSHKFKIDLSELNYTTTAGTIDGL